MDNIYRSIESRQDTKNRIVVKHLDKTKMVKATLLLFWVFLYGCAVPAHKVDHKVIEANKHKIFSVGKIAVPACIPYSAKFFPDYTDMQKKALKEVHVSEIINTLNNNYGLKIDTDINTTLNECKGFSGALMSPMCSKCIFLINHGYQEDGDIVNIILRLESISAWLTNIKLRLNYEVIVKSKGEALVRHTGELTDITFTSDNLKRLDDIVWENIISHASKINAALVRDINIYRKNQQ